MRRTRHRALLAKFDRNRLPETRNQSSRHESRRDIKALWTGRPLRTLSDAIAEKAASEMDDYPGQAERHLAELKAILDEEEPVYRS